MFSKITISNAYALEVEHLSSPTNLKIYNSDIVFVNGSYFFSNDSSLSIFNSNIHSGIPQGWNSYILVNSSVETVDIIGNFSFTVNNSKINLLTLNAGTESFLTVSGSEITTMKNSVFKSPLLLNETRISKVIYFLLLFMQ